MKMLIATVLLLGACSANVAEDPVQTARAETRLGELLAGKEPGPRSACVSRINSQRQTIVDERTIIFRPGSGSNRLYRSDLAPSCPGLERNSTIIRRSTSSSICSGEIFEVRDGGTQFPRGSCTFGEFTEYRTLPR